MVRGWLVATIVVSAAAGAPAQWLAGNRARLTDSEVGVLQERIEFVTPERYARQPQAERDKAEQAKCWLEWMAYELADYVPTIRP